MMARDEQPNDKPVTVVRPPLVAGGQLRAIIPDSLEGCFRLSQIIVAAKLAPASLDSVEKCCVAIMHGLEVGLKPMEALQSIAVIGGRPTIYGDGMLALVRGSGLLEEIVEEVELDDSGEPTIATCRVKRRGEAQWAISSFTRPEAQRAGLWNKAGPWQQYRQRMMKMRARSWALRDKFADVLRGLHMAEEALDMGSVSIAPPPREPRRSDVEHDTVETGAAAVPDRPAADAGPAAAQDGHPVSPPVSPSPFPKSSAEVESEPTHGGPATADARHSPPSEHQSPPDLSMPLEHWRVGDDVVGQENLIARLVKLVGLVETLADLDAIESQNAERLAKITGVRRANLNNALRIKRESFDP
jgi:hypothetical protein